MTVILNDTFVRSPQSGWGTATDGKTWSNLTGPATAAINGSNEGTLTGSVTQTIFVLSANTYTDLDLVVRMANTANADSIYVVFRATASNNYYRVRMQNQTLALHKIITGTATQLATFSTAVTAGSFIYIRIKVVGTTIQAKNWNSGSTENMSWGITLTDSSITSAGQIGLGCTLNSSSNTASYDNLYVYDYSLAESYTLTETITEENDESTTESPSYSEPCIFENDWSTTESNSTTDSSSFSPQGSGSQSLTCTEIVSEENDEKLIDTPLYSEANSYETDETTSESSVLLDVSLFSPQGSGSDTTTVLEVVSEQMGGSLVDPTGIGETATFQVAGTLTDAISALESYFSEVDTSICDPWTVIETVAIQLQASLAESTALLDVSRYAVLVLSSQVLTLVESATGEMLLKPIPIYAIVTLVARDGRVTLKGR